MKEFKIILSNTFQGTSVRQQFGDWREHAMHFEYVKDRVMHFFKTKGLESALRVAREMGYEFTITMAPNYPHLENKIGFNSELIPDIPKIDL